MANSLKRVISVVLVVLLSFACVLPAFAEGGATENIPILRIRSNLHEIRYTNENGEKVGLFDDGEYVSEIVDAALPYAALGLATGNWDKWCEVALEKMLPAYEHFKPDEQGNLPAESPAAEYKEPSSYTRNDSYGVNNCYQIKLDQRVSPIDGADYINEVVEQIKRVTGHDTIHLVGQCMGSAYMLAYLYKYAAPEGYAGLESVTFSTVTSNGTPGEDALFSGTMKFDFDSAYQVLNMYAYPDSLSQMAGGTLLQVIYDTLDLVYNTRLLKKVTMSTVQRVYDAVKDKFIAGLLKEYYGRCGGYVSLAAFHYDQYRDYVFPTAEDKAKYSAQIAKFDQFHYDIQMHQKDMIDAMRASGVSVYCFAQYGYQYGFLACGELGMETSDQTVPVSSASFGATAARFGEKLSDEYIKGRKDAGFGDYIAPDGEIDASTGLLPDTTWYVKNLNHNFDFPSYMALLTTVIRTPQADADKILEKGYSRFSFYNKDTDSLSPLTADQAEEQEPASPRVKGFFRSLIELFKSVFEMLKALLKK